MEEQEEQDFSSTASATEVVGAIVFRCDLENVPILKKFISNKLDGRILYQTIRPREVRLRVIEETRDR